MGDAAVLVKPRPRDERGSLIVALAIIFVLVLLLAAIGNEVIGGQLNVVSKSHASASVSAADAGLADALFQLDQLSPATGSSFCLDASGTGVIGGATCAKATGGLSGVAYIARPNDASGTVWTIRSKAQVNGIWGAVSEQVEYSEMYAFAIFGTGGLDFNGSASTLGGYTETPSSSSNPDISTSDCTGSGSTASGASCIQVGSNGPIKCAGGLPTNVSEVYYTGGGGASKCSEPVPNGSKNNPTIPSAPTSGAPLTCPGVKTTDASGDTIYELGSGFAAAQAAGWGTIPAGTYYCQNAAIAISGILNVSGQVQLYTILDASTDNAFISNGLQTLNIAGGSEVNTGFSATSGLPPSNTTLPVASNFQFLSNTTGTVGNANGGGTSGPYTFGGVIYAPNGNLTGNGCKSVYFGSLVINTLTCNGGPHLQVYYDNALKSVYGPPTVTGYSQVNPASFSVP